MLISIKKFFLSKAWRKIEYIFRLCLLYQINIKLYILKKLTKGDLLRLSIFSPVTNNAALASRTLCFQDLNAFFNTQRETFNAGFIDEYIKLNREMLRSEKFSINEICPFPKSVTGVFTSSKSTLPIFQHLQIFFNDQVIPLDQPKNWESISLAYNWGLTANVNSAELIKNASSYNIPMIFLEDGFLRSTCSWADQNASFEDRAPLSFALDWISVYSDANDYTSLEILLNSDFELSLSQKIYASTILKKIQLLKLSKYNHQPIFTPVIGRAGVKKVLVVDQNYGDTSILKGMASDLTFKDMLDCAISENPNADIIIKTHPDEICSDRVKGYFSDVKEAGNIYKFTKPINPISLLEYIDKVYVCTTQMGLEAAMLKKEVHVFGAPFYCNWGITIDRQSISRRVKRRSIVEVFYLIYIVYIHYINPATKMRGTIEEAMLNLLEMREIYFNTHSVQCDSPKLLKAR